MCGITGFCNHHAKYLLEKEKYYSILSDMSNAIKHRGPDGSGSYLTNNAALAHVRLAIIDVDGGAQPITKTIDGKEYTIVYNGETYNAAELRGNLAERGWEFETSTDTEVVLAGIIEYGADFVKQMNGIFAFAVWDGFLERLYLFRDRLGVKPLFYTIRDNTLIFASELKALFAYPEINPEIDINGLNEIFSLGPAKTYGNGVFKNIREILPANYTVFDKDGFKTIEYWKLESRKHEDSYSETIGKTAYLVRDAIVRQTVSDVPICSFLSGGLDSSLVSAVCSEHLKKSGKQLTTFSFDFVGNDKYYKSNSFQPSQDRPYVDEMVKFLGTKHIYLECNNNDLADMLYDSVDAKDLPGMADVDASLLYFCKIVGKDYKVALTGETADEIFGGYPWFRSETAFNADAFPWTMDISARKTMLKDDFIKILNMEEYISNAYHKTLCEVPMLDGESKDDKRRREIAFLNLKWFMQTLLDRMDRASMSSGLEARVPFADHRIVEYVWNIPWEMKYKDGIVKNILRQAGRGILPDSILFRKKSPYPKTYNPEYENILIKRLTDVINTPSEPINQFIDKAKVEKFMQSPSDYGKPWYGQLMAAPQRLAYMLQVNYWLKKYNIHIV